MDDNLKILIAYYEEERQNLLRMIDEYIKEWEYQFAQFHSQALLQVNNKLQTIYFFQDKLSGEKLKEKVILKLNES